MLIFPIFFSIVVYSIACLGLGGIISNVISAQNKDVDVAPSIDTATRFLLGQGLLANLWVFIALTGNFSPPIVNGIIAILFILGILFNYKHTTGVARTIPLIWREFMNESRGWKLLILAILTMWLAWLTSIGRPPTADGTRFYLALPKVISSSERLKPLPGYEEVASLGLQGEMHFAALMTMGSPEATQVFSWLTLTAGCILLLALGRKVGLQRRGQWLVLAMIFTSSAVIELSGSGKTDMYGATFAFAAYYWAFQIEKKNQNQASILTGLFGGLAVVAKVSYAASFLPSLAVILAWRIFSQEDTSLKSKMAYFALIGVSAVFIAIQLPIKNQILFNNPLAPFGMKDIFDQVWYGPDTINRIRLTLPLALTFGDYWAQIGNLTPLVLMFSPLILLLPKPRRLYESPLIVLGIAALVGLACWFIYRPAVFAPRYFLGCLLLLVLPTSKGAEIFSQTDKTNNIFILATTVITILSMGLYYSSHIFLPKQTFDLIVNKQPDCEFDPVQCEITNHINLIVAPGERIFTNDSYRYWLRSDLIQCALTSLEMENYFSIETPEQRWSFIIGRGFKSVLIYYRDIPLSNKIRSDMLAIPDWLEVKTIKTNINLIFLQLSLKNNSHPILYECRQSNYPEWEIFEIQMINP